MRSARVITVIPCRTKSTRLPQKALLPIHGISSIERCLLQTLAIERSMKSVLATSSHPSDTVLAQHTLGDRVDFVQGSEDDVLERLFLAIEHHEAQVIIRVTGDCPVVS